MTSTRVVARAAAARRFVGRFVICSFVGLLKRIHEPLPFPYRFVGVFVFNPCPCPCPCPFPCPCPCCRIYACWHEFGMEVGLLER